MDGVKKYWWVAGLLLALGLVLLSPLASAHPDGLERVAQDQGFSQREQKPPFEILAGYLWPGVENEGVATVLSGLVGTAILFAVGSGLSLLLRRRRREPAGKP